MFLDVLVDFSEAEFGELIWFVNQKGLIQFVDV